MKINFLKIHDELEERKRKLERRYRIDISTVFFSREYKNLDISGSYQNDGVFTLNIKEKSGGDYTFEVGISFREYELCAFEKEGENTIYYTKLQEVVSILNKRAQKELEEYYRKNKSNTVLDIMKNETPKEIK